MDYYKLFPCCKLIKGYSRSAIQDINRLKFKTIPNDLFKILSNNNGVLSSKDIAKLRKTTVGEEYFNFLLDEEIIFKINSKWINNFPEISDKYLSPFDVENFSIDFKWLKNNLYMLDVLEKINVHNLIINVDFLNILNLREIIDTIQNTSQYVNNIAIRTSKIKGNEIITIDNMIGNSVINYIVAEIFDFQNSKHIYDVNNKKFNIWTNNNLLFYNKSNMFYPYTFKTLNINKDGYITNTYFSYKKYKKVTKTTAANDFTKIMNNISNELYYKVRKKDINICQDCEFKNLCNDRDIPKHRKQDNSWFMETECNYNPYICKWEGEEGYKTLAECGVVSDEKGFSIDHEKIAEINEELWGE